MKQNLKHVRKKHLKLQSWDRRLAGANFRTEQRQWFCELPDSASSDFFLCQPTKVIQMILIMEPSRIETISVSNCSNQVHQ